MLDRRTSPRGDPDEIASGRQGIEMRWLGTCDEFVGFLFFFVGTGMV